MPKPSYLPVSTLIEWANRAGFVRESVLVLGRMPDGTVQVGNAGETGPEIVQLLDDAAAMFRKNMRPAEPCDDASDPVRQSTDKAAKSHAAAG